MPKMSPSAPPPQDIYNHRVPSAMSSIPTARTYPGQYINTNGNLGTYRRASQPATPTFPQQESTEAPPTGRTRWGPPIWTFFHTLAEKVKPDYFPVVKTGLLNLINQICINLPCPDCANHASQYMRAVNFNSIQTKEDLKNMLYRFHNSVNGRKGSPFFDYGELTSKYSTANTSIVIQQFMEVFSKKSYSIRMIANDFHKSRFIIQMKQWLANNLQYFDP